MLIGPGMCSLFSGLFSCVDVVACAAKEDLAVIGIPCPLFSSLNTQTRDPLYNPLNQPLFCIGVGRLSWLHVGFNSCATLALFGIQHVIRRFRFMHYHMIMI